MTAAINDPMNDSTLGNTRLGLWNMSSPLVATVQANEHIPVGHYDVVGLGHWDDGMFALLGNLLATWQTGWSCHVAALWLYPDCIAVGTDW